MKILHLDTGTGWRGGQQQVLWLMEGLRERGLEQLLVAPAGSPLAETARKQGLEVGALSSPETSLANVRALRRIAGQFDILHAHDSHGHSLAWLARFGLAAWREDIVAGLASSFPVG